MVFDDTRSYIIDRIKSRKLTIDEFNWEKLWAPPISALFTPQDIAELKYIASSLKLSAKTKEKISMIDAIMMRRGFRRYICGTNRLTYACIEDDSFLIKVAYNNVGRQDAPREYRNQFALKPFVTRIFEYTPCGTLAVCERVNPITSREEFRSVAEDIYTLINDWLLGEYVLDDIGTNYFMNYGLRLGFGIVLLDYPYMFKVDYGKLTCTLKDKTGTTLSGCCEGEIDYDDGYNKLICTKCGAIYKAIDLAKAIEEEKIIIKHTVGGIEKMELLKIKISGGSKKLDKEIVLGGKNNMFAKNIPSSKPIIPSSISEFKEEVSSKSAAVVAVNGVEVLDEEIEKPKEEQVVSTTEIEVNEDKKEEKEIPVVEESKEEKKVEKEIITPFVVHDPESERIKEIAAEAEKKIQENVKKEERTSTEIAKDALLTAFDEFDQKGSFIDIENDELIQTLCDLLTIIPPSLFAAAMKKLIEEYEHIGYRMNVIDTSYNKEGDKDLILVTVLVNLLIGNGDNMAEVDILNNEPACFGLSMDMLKKIANENNLSLSDPKDKNKVYEGFKDYAAKTISRKDIIQSENPENVIALIGSDGNYITDKSDNIVCVAKLDGKNVTNLVTVSNNWYKNTKKQLEELDTEEKHEIPVGAAPTMNGNVEGNE